MIIHSPFSISSRLLPSLLIGGATVQLEYSRRPGDDGRTRYRWTIDLPDDESYSDDDQQSGCQGGSLQEGFESLLSFLDASAEDDNANLFPRPIVEWAYQNSDEIGMLRLEIEESETELIDE